MAWNDWGFVDAKQLFDPGNFIWDHKSNAPTQFQNNDQFQGLLQGAQGDPNAAWWSQDVTHMQAPQLQMGNDPFRQGQLSQMQQLQGVAGGQQQGAGELAAQRQIANALAAQQAQARMARGGNAALASRNAANQSAALGLSGVGMGQQAALGDQQAAQQQLAGVTGAGRQGDIGVAQQNAGLQQNTNQLNSGNYLQTLGMLNTRDIAKYNADLGIGAQQNQADAAKSGGLIAGLGAIISDERLKTDISDADDDIDEMLDALTPKSGKYKDAEHGDGEWNWVMAQDMERSRAGRRVVRDVGGAKVLDKDKTISTLLASAARLNKRVRKLEGEKR